MKKQDGGKLLWVSLGIYLFLFLVALVATKMLIEDLKAQKSRLEAKIGIMEEDKTNLRSNIQLEEGEERISQAARDRLGLVQNEGTNYVLVVPVTEYNARNNFQKK
jgi:cell division protein FtsB